MIWYLITKLRDTGLTLIVGAVDLHLSNIRLHDLVGIADTLCVQGQYQSKQYKMYWYRYQALTDFLFFNATVEQLLVVGRYGTVIFSERVNNS